MRHIKGFVFGLVFLAVGAIWLGSSGCNADKPTQSTVPKDYPVYSWDCNLEEVYLAYHPTTNQIDTFPVSIPRPLTWNGLFASADGASLYFSLGSSVAILDLASNSLIDSLPYKAVLAVSPDNRLIAVRDDLGFYILNTSDYSEVFHDTDFVLQGTFSTSSTGFYANCYSDAGVPSRYYVCYVDLADTLLPVVRVPFDDGALMEIMPSLDETKWFLCLAYEECHTYFEVYDVSTDSIVFEDEIGAGLGELEMSVDGRYVFYATPGSDHDLCLPPPRSIKVYDVLGNSIHCDISTTGVFDPPHDDYGVPVGNMCATPDGRSLVATGSPGYYFLVVDIESMSITRYLSLSSSEIYCITGQIAP